MFRDRAQIFSYGTAGIPKKCRISESQVLDNTGIHSQEQDISSVHTIQHWQEGRLAWTEKVTPS